MENNSSDKTVKLECDGVIRASNGKRYECDFTCRQTLDGNVYGTIDYSKSIGDEILRLTANLECFELEGKEKERDYDVICKQCYMTSSRGYFKPAEVEVNYEKLSEEPPGNIALKFEIVNMDETFRISLPTNIGYLALYHCENLDELIDKIKRTGRTLITSSCKLELDCIENSTLEGIISKAENIVSKFLLITSLGQGCYHDWCNVQVFRKNEENYKRIYHKYRNPKPKPPTYKQITNKAHSREFVIEAYKGYDESLNEQYDFDIALEWYLESNIATIVESKFLMAFTALELIVQRYSSDGGNEFVINQNDFEGLQEILKEKSRDYLKNKLEVSSQRRSEFYRKLTGLNRRPIREKIKDFLEDKNVKYKDVFSDLSELTGTRHKIVHEGKYSDSDELIDVYYRIYELLTRIFLNLLDYNKDYFSHLKGEWLSLK